jgi:membrane-associated progesterone receptor component
LRSSPPATLPKGPTPIVFQTYTPRTLLKNNGQNNAPVYLAVRGKVYDVTSGRNFYGPGGPYENFAGRDATRGLACQSFDEDMLTKDLDGPLDPCDDLSAEQLENLKGWIERFDEKVRRSPSIKNNPYMRSSFFHRPLHTLPLHISQNQRHRRC